MKLLFRRPLHYLIAVLIFSQAIAFGANVVLKSQPHIDTKYKFSVRLFRYWNQTPPNMEEESAEGMILKLNNPKEEAKRGYWSNLGSLWALQIHRFPKIQEAPPREPLPDGKEGEDDKTLKKRYEEALQSQAPKTFKDLVKKLSFLSYPDGKSLSKSKLFKKSQKITTSEKVSGTLWILDSAISNFIARQPNFAEYEKKPFSVAILAASLNNGEEEYGFFCTCPANRYKKIGMRKAFTSLIKSFKFKERKKEAFISKDKRELESEKYKDEYPVRAARRREVKEKHQSNPDWGWEDTEHYLVIYNKKFKKGKTKNNNAFLAKSIARELEMMRRQHYTKYLVPLEPIDALGIVRVCRDRSEYLSYGGSPGSAGYWSSAHDEFVFYDSSNSKALDDRTREVLLHEGFHQYLSYALKGGPVHIWINEGHADYFGGAELKGKSFIIKKNKTREGTAKKAVASGTCPPIRKLLKMTQREHYGNAHLNYAVGWSLVFFLNKVTKNSEYKKLNRSYFDAVQRGIKEGLKGEALKKMALDESFMKTDLDKLEARWHEGVKKL